MKKIFRLFVCLVCAVALLAPALPVSYAFDGELTLSVSNTVYLAVGERVSRTFTPEISGSYAFWAANDTEMGYNAIKMDVYAADGSGQPRNDRFSHEGVQGMVCELEAGKTYCFDLWWDLHGYGYTYTYGVEPASSTISISFAPDNRSDYEGDEWNLYPVLSSPGAVLNDITWSSSDPSVVSVEKDGMSHAVVRLKKTGTAVITAAAGDVSGSCTIEVLPPYELRLGKEIIISHPEEGGYDFSFMPETSGRYVIYANHQIPVGLLIPGDILFFNDMQGTSYELKAGVEYSGSVFVPREPPIETLLLRVVTYDEWETKVAAGLDPEQWHTVQCMPGEILFTKPFSIMDEEGEYYLTIVGGFPGHWIVDPEITELERFEDFENGILQIKMDLPRNANFCLVYPGEDLSEPMEASFLLSREKTDVSQWQRPESEPEPGSEPSVSDTKETEDLAEWMENAETGATVEVPAGLTDVTFSDGTAFLESSTRDLTVVLFMDSGKMELDTTVQEKIGVLAGENKVTVVLAELEPETLSRAQQDTLNSPEAMGGDVERILEASIFCGGNYLHDFEGGTATVTVSHFDPEKEYTVYCIDAGGGIEEISCTNENGVVSFTTEHFSVFAVVARSEQADVPSEEPKPTADLTEPSPAGGGKAVGIGAAIVAAVVLAAAVAFVISKKKK